MSISHTIVYSGDIATAFIENNITEFMVLNESLAVVYENEQFDPNILLTIPEISYSEENEPMNSLINITNRFDVGETVSEVSDISFINKNPYVTASGKDILIAIIDSGIDYLHPDFINNDNTSKIVSIWDQSSNEQTPPDGMIFGSEFTREDINEAIRENDNTLTQDETGTGTVAAGICSGRGNLNPNYSGVAIDSELIVVKLREYEDTYKIGTKNYIDTDFLAAIKYVLDVSKRENKSIIINLTVAGQSISGNLTNYLDTFTELSTPNNILVSGAGNEGNTDIHHEGSFLEGQPYTDIRVQVGEQNFLDIDIRGVGPDKLSLLVISPSGELGTKIDYAPDNYIYHGKFSLENTNYSIRTVYPYFFTGNQFINVYFDDIKPGIWTLRLYPLFIIRNVFDIYLPNKDLISQNTRIIDPQSFATITRYAYSENVITVGAYDNKTSSLWPGSSQGSIRYTQIKPDIVAPGVDIISTFLNSSYTTATGTGVSSSLVCGALAVVMEYVDFQGDFQRARMTTKVLNTLLMLGANRQLIYDYPNESYGYGNLSLRGTIEAVSQIL